LTDGFPNDPESYIGNHFPETLVMSAGRPALSCLTRASLRRWASA
jgi:hypothetical protein